jgi:hypothetical protein
LATNPGQVQRPALRAMRQWSTELARDERAKKIIQWALLVLIFRQAIAAPIRAYAPVVWYLPDIGVGIGFAAMVYLGLRNRVVAFLALTGLILALIVYSLMLNPVGAVALSARNFAYVVLAVLAGIGVRRGDQTMTVGIAVAGGIAILGIYYDYLFEVPWAGAVFSGVLQTGDVAREWFGGGVRRLSGLGIASTDTAVIIAVGALACCALTESRIRVVSAIYAAAAVHTLLLTTQKATAGWLFVVLAVAYVAPLLRFRASGFQSAPVLRWLGIAGLLGAILVPPLFLNIRFGEMMSVEAETLDMRTALIWPAVIPMLWSIPQAIIGYGMGGVGQTATIEALHTVDNMFLYTALTLGLPLTLAIFALGVRAFQKASVRDATDFSALAMATIVVLNGITANVLATGGVAGIYLGFAIGCLLRPTRRSRSETAPDPVPDAEPSGRRRRRRRSA